MGNRALLDIIKSKNPTIKLLSYEISPLRIDAKTTMITTSKATAVFARNTDNKILSFLFLIFVNFDT